MDLAFCSFSSGSSGNCYLVKSDSTNILVDAGISGEKIVDNLRVFDMSIRKIDAVVLSHEHWDHTRSAQMVQRLAVYSNCYATCGTLEGMGDKAERLPKDRLVKIHNKESFMIGDIEVKSFPISHDALDPVAFTLKRNDKKIAIVTDTGCITDEIQEEIKDSDLLVIESNHEENILLYGKYPYYLKRRILSDKGHLSNEAAGNCICKFLKDLNKQKPPRILLGHMSKENNTPKQAFLTVRNILEEDGYYVGKDLLLDVLEKGIMTDLIFL